MKFKPKMGYCKDFFGKKYCVRGERCENAKKVGKRARWDGVKIMTKIQKIYQETGNWADWSSKVVEKGEVKKVEDVLKE